MTGKGKLLDLGKWEEGGMGSEGKGKERKGKEER